MKKHVLLLAALLFAAGTTTIYSCSHEHGEETHEHGDDGEHDHDDAEEVTDTEAGDTEEGQLSSTLYQCPMDCGDGEAFWEPGNCPVCGMEMEVIKETN